MILEFFASLLIAYLILKYLRRKFCSPNYNGTLVWITGASSGIGQALAVQFNNRGAQLIISARNVKQLERVKERCKNPEKVRVVKMDMVNYQQAKKDTQEILTELENKGTKLDVIIQNAGVSMRCDFMDYPFENHQAVFNVNVHGVYNHLQVISKHMIKNKSGQIVVISSLAGRLSTACRTSYAGSKAAIIGIMDSIRSQLYNYGIVVTNIMPGYIKTKISQNALSGGVGEKFGKMDSNISSGMDVDKFAVETVKAIYLKQTQAQISELKFGRLWVVMRALIPQLAFFGLRMNAKNQKQALRKSV